MNAAVTMSIPDFSEHIGCKRNYAYQLKKEGRLVMAADGKQVMVAESIERIAQTRDPSKAGVANRHASERGAVALTGHDAQDDGASEGVAATAATTAPDAPAVFGYDYQSAKAKREFWAAEREHVLWRKEAGALMERPAVLAAFADAGALVRSKMEGLVTALPPQLAGRDESAIRAILADEIERLLHDLVDKFGRFTKDSKDTTGGAHG